jgi:hypothetical protein
MAKTKPTLTRLADSDEFRDATAKLEEFRLTRDTVARRVRELDAVPADDMGDIDRAAVNLMSGDGGTALAQRADVSAELKTERGRLTVLVRAIELQEAEVAAIRTRLGRQIAAGSKPEHDAKLERLVKAFAEVYAAVEDEREFRRSLRADVPEHALPELTTPLVAKMSPFVRDMVKRCEARGIKLPTADAARINGMRQ